MNNPNGSKNNFFMNVLLAIVVGMTLATGSFGWLTFKSADELMRMHKRNEEIVRLQGIVMHFDEVLTMSARMAAVTGDTKWETRYRQFEPALDQAIKKLISLQPEQVKAAEETDAANLKLVDMENEAFHFVRQNQPDKASAILLSSEYEKQKDIYSHGNSEFYKNIEAALKYELSHHNDKVNRLKIVLFLFLISSFCGWVFVFFKTRQWNKHLAMVNEQLDQKVKVQTAQLLNSSKMSALGEMAGGVAHEINTPLAIIKTLSEQLREVVEDEPLDKVLVTDMVGNVEKTADRIAKIVQGLRSFSRGGDQDPFHKVIVCDLIHDTLSFCGERFKSDGTIVTIKDFDKNLFFDGRSNEISQVLLNLLNNANDAISSYKEKWIDISVVEHKEWLEIQVTDCGGGIPADVRDKIFQPFFTTKEIGKGTGLGLSISLGIIQKHNGELKLDTSCQNTRFVIRLPKKQSAS